MNLGDFTNLIVLSTVKSPSGDCISSTKTVHRKLSCSMVFRLPSKRIM